MFQYFLQRLLLAVPVVFIVSILIFMGVRLIPGEVCRIVLEVPEATQEQCDAVNAHLGLDKPAITQYINWMGGMLHGDFGTSFRSGRDVFTEIRDRAPLTIELSILAMGFALLIGIPVGVYSAVKQDKVQDYGLRILTIGWLSMPNFWVATMLITFPAVWWGYSPPVVYASIWEDPLLNLQRLYLPAIALGLSLSATLARFARSAMLDVLRQDYVRTARSKGLTERGVLARHALKNAMLPVVTLIGLQMGFLLGGTVILEQIFSLPGLGTLTLESVFQKDYLQVQGIVFIFSIMIVMINILVDLSYAWLDPRIRY